MPAWAKKTIELAVSVAVALGALLTWTYTQGGSDAFAQYRAEELERRLETHLGSPDLHMTIAQAQQQSGRLARLEQRQQSIADDVSDIKSAVNLLVKREMERTR